MKSRSEESDYASGREFLPAHGADGNLLALMIEKHDVDAKAEVALMLSEQLQRQRN